MNRVAYRRTPARSGTPARPAPESEALLRFRKIIELELRRGCDDGAVIGGLDRFLTNARSDKAIASVIDAAVPGRAYAQMTPAVREKWLRVLLATKPSSKPEDGRAGEGRCEGSAMRRSRSSRRSLRRRPTRSTPT